MTGCAPVPLLGLLVALRLLVALGLGGCVSTGLVSPVEDVAPGERPPIATDEAGLWMAFDQAEKHIRSSGRVVYDEALNTYVREILCRLAPGHCADIRFYILEVPHLNAAMGPNGMMMIWTGLLLRAQNEAQLAYILGHEVGHYLRRHSVQRWRDIRIKSDAASFFTVAMALAGIPYAIDATNILTAGSIMAFSREHEREADDVGIELMARAGYDPREAAAIWGLAIEERNAADDPEPFIFFATHPSSAQRMERLAARAPALTLEGGVTTGEQTYRATTRAYRRQWLRKELRKREFAASQVILKRLLAAEPRSAELRFYQGELLRLRNHEGDDPLAIEAYRESLQYPHPPAETYRSLGLVLWRTGQNAEAANALERYLALSPDAPDRAIVESYVTTLSNR